MKLIHGTPFDKVVVDEKVIWVKREDSCFLPVAFSKMRGVLAHLKTIKSQYIGVLDTFHSKAGWGVSCAGKVLGKNVVVFYPEYKDESGLRVFQKMCKKNGAELISLTAGRSCVLYHQSKKILREKYKNSYMMPNALKLAESVEENCRETFEFTPKHLVHDTILVISISSGTVATGVLKGFALMASTNEVYLHMGYSRSKKAIGQKIMNSLEPDLWGNVPPCRMKINFIDENYSYKDKANIYGLSNPPFPCNPYYDLKAWAWLMKNINKLDQTKNILFWNIGA
jgi:hypothetical protein